ncbi:MAG TPA: aldo/keto reductase [Thermoanaerobaculia bacterium]|jgi:aryl-alcohol dehydrogenase-like predicted oxidoreductase
MRTRRIGSLEVSVVGVGCNNFGRRLDAAETARVVDAALDAGINFFDTADTYGKTNSEVFLGRAIASRRQDVVIATKFGMDVDEERQGAHPDYVLRAADDSLRRLGVDVIDLYQLHTPDPRVPIADTLGALDELVRAGKVREIGCSNFSAEQLREARRAAGDRARFVSVQNEYSLLHRTPERDGVLDECAAQHVAFLPYFPLANGLLTGKYRRGLPAPAGRLAESWNGGKIDDTKLDTAERLIAFAESRGHTVLELAFSWLLAHEPVASVIAGATRVEQIAANASAANWVLTDAELEELDHIT